MAMYFHSNSEIQAAGADGLQTLVLMNPGYIQYSDSPPPPLPQQPNGGNLVFHPHAPPSYTQQFVGTPLSAAAASQSMHPHHDVSALHGFLPRMQYNLWNTIDPNTAAREATRASEGLSLSLQAQAPAITGDDVRVSGGSPSSASGVTNGVSGVQSVLLGSKYLKATQELLDEIVTVNNGVESELGKKSFDKTKVVGESTNAGNGDGSVGGERSGGKRSYEISANERQDIQTKKAKLISMLNEVFNSLHFWYLIAMLNWG